MPTPRPPASDDPLVRRLRAAGCVFAEEEAALLVGSADGPAALAEAVARRTAGEPLAHVLGWAELDGERVRVDPGVFVPRPRSTPLLRAAERLLADRGAPLVVDLGCGSGVLATVLARRHPGWRLHACDHDPVATRCARANAAGTGIAVHTGHWFEPLPVALVGRVDLVVAHLPYVPTADLPLLPGDLRAAEPTHAVDGGADGLDPLRAVAADAGRWLAPGGALVTEVTAAQQEAALAIGRRAGLTAGADTDPEAEVVLLTVGRVG